MVLRICPGTKKASLLSRPYDAFVPLYGSIGSNKIIDTLKNGPSALVKTIEQVLPIPIKGFVEENFGVVVNLVQALGGIKQISRTLLKIKILGSRNKKIVNY